MIRRLDSELGTIEEASTIISRVVGSQSSIQILSRSSQVSVEILSRGSQVYVKILSRGSQVSVKILSPSCCKIWVWA